MRKIVIIAVLIGLVGLLSACASKPSIKASSVKETQAAKVTKCRFLGQVSGSAAHEGFALFEGTTKAKNDALDVAATLGATHVVWIETTGGLNPTARGKAYRCSTGFSKMIFPPRPPLYPRTGAPPAKEVKAWLSGVITGLNGQGPAVAQTKKPAQE